MKVSSLAVGLIALEAASVLALPTGENNVVTVTVTGTDTHLTHRYGRFNKTKKAPTASHTGTHRNGRFDHTKKSSSPSHTGTHRNGRFDHTKKSSSPSHTGTHRNGRFDHTKKSSSPSHTGTHRNGRFDHTKKSSSPSHTGTHRYGRFDKTKKARTSTVYVQESAAVENKVVIRAVSNASNASNATLSSTLSSNGAVQLSGSNFGYTLGSAAFVGAAMLLL